MPTQLFGDRYAPITSEIGFLECEPRAAAAAYEEWQRPIQAKRCVSISGRDIHGDFVSKIVSLLPLTNIERRRVLFLPTKEQWTTYLDNGWQGADAFSVVSYLSQRIGCRGIRAVSIPNTFKKSTTGACGRYGATIFELYGPTSEGCPFLNTKRSVFAANDGGRWKFGATGEPLPFEDLGQYDVRRIQDRFTSEMLERYLANFGIKFFSEEFYDVSEPAWLLSKDGPCAVGLKNYSLNEVQSKYDTSLCRDPEGT